MPRRNCFTKVLRPTKTSDFFQHNILQVFVISRMKLSIFSTKIVMVCLIELAILADC